MTSISCDLSFPTCIVVQSKTVYYMLIYSMSFLQRNIITKPKQSSVKKLTAVRWLTFLTPENSPKNVHEKNRKYILGRIFTSVAPSGEQKTSSRVVRMLITSPSRVMLFGAHVKGTCSISHRQKTWNHGSIRDCPEALYWCSFKCFNCVGDKTSFIISHKEVQNP